MSVSSCLECSAEKVHGKGLCRRCYNRRHYQSQVSTPSGLLKRRALERGYKRREVGFSDDLVAALRAEQRGNCAACGVRTETGCGVRGEVVDHDHQTGKPRGLLCNACNRLVGRYEAGRLRAPGLIARCAAYLSGTPVSRLSLLCLLLLSTACAADPALWSCATLLAVGTAVAIASWCRYVWRIDAESAADLEEMGYRVQAERRAARIPRWLRARYLARARRAADAAVSP